MGVDCQSILAYFQSHFAQFLLSFHFIYYWTFEAGSHYAAQVGL